MSSWLYLKSDLADHWIYNDPLALKLWLALLLKIDFLPRLLHEGRKVIPLKENQIIFNLEELAKSLSLDLLQAFRLLRRFQEEGLVEMEPSSAADSTLLTINNLGFWIRPPDNFLCRKSSSRGSASGLFCWQECRGCRELPEVRPPGFFETPVDEKWLKSNGFSSSQADICCPAPD